MTPETDHRADERHDDLTRLNETFNSAKKTVMGWLIPMIGVAIITLVANHFEQKRMSEQIAQLNVQISTMNRRFEVMNEKVIAMWVGGDWHTKFKTTEQAHE